MNLPMQLKSSIRELRLADAPAMAADFAAQGWHKPAAQFEAYFQESVEHKRAVLVAEADNEFAGYVTIVWESDYPPFRAAGIPEIVDLNVLKRFQRRGIGTALIRAAEERIAIRSPTAGIGVGLMHDYGQAQRLYVKLGYMPDGRGIFARGRWLEEGDALTLAHDVALYLTRNIKPGS